MKPCTTHEEHRAARNLSDRVALGITMLLRFFADTFFAKRYGNRAIVLETWPPCPAWWAACWSTCAACAG
jgi:ubiquinol oxidase